MQLTVTIWRESSQVLAGDARVFHEAGGTVLRTGLPCVGFRQQLSLSKDVVSGELLTTELVRRAANVVVQSLDLPPPLLPLFDPSDPLFATEP